MSRTYKRFDEWLAIWMADYLPKLLEGQTDFQREGVQLVAWLVGLSVGLIALLVADAGSEGPWLGSMMTTVAVALATGTVFFRVLYRAAVHIAQGWAHRHFLDLRMELSMRTADMDFGPGELSEHWDVPEIVDRLRNAFGLDYSFLIDHGVSLDKARSMYREIFDQEKQWEREALQEFVRVVSAFADLTEDQEEGMVRARTDRDLEGRRENMKRIQAYERASGRTFLLTGLTFVLTIAAIAIGVIGRL